MNNDELSGGWVSFLWIGFSHLGALSQPMFWDELIKHEEKVIGHRVCVKVEGLQQRSGWSAELEAMRKSLLCLTGCSDASSYYNEVALSS